jgi:hypothetical protein
MVDNVKGPSGSWTEPGLGVEVQEATSCAPRPATSTSEVPSPRYTPGMHEPDPNPSRTTYSSVHTDTQRGVTIGVREGRACHEFEITQMDWSAVDHARFGPSVDLVVSLRLREHLGRSDLVQVDLLTADFRDIDGGDWPDTLGGTLSVEIGVSFRAGLRLRAGMDQFMAAELDHAWMLSDSHQIWTGPPWHWNRDMIDPAANRRAN